MKPLFPDLKVRGKAYNSQLTQLREFLEQYPLPKGWTEDLLTLFRHRR